MKRCMYCGNESDDANQTCSKCGNGLLDIPPQQVMPAEEVPEEEISLGDMDINNESSDIKISEEVLEEEQPAVQMGQNPEQGYYGEQGYPWQMDVQRGQTYAAQQQPYMGQAYENQAYSGMPYGGYASNSEQPDVQQQYGGQAYGYQQPTQQYGYPSQPQDGYDYGRVQPQGMGGSAQIMSKSRGMVKSPLFLLVLLFHTVMTVSSIINMVGGNAIQSLNAVQATLEGVFGANVAISFLNGIIDMVEGISSGLIVIGGAVLNLPSAVICIGLWMAFLCTKKHEDYISTAGYTLTRVMILLEFIFTCLVLTAGLIISVAFVVAAGASSSTTSIIVGIILLVVLIIVSLFAILFYVQFLHCLKVVKLNVKAGADPGRIAVFVPVVGIIMGILTALSMIPMSPDDILGLVSQGTTAAWLLFGSVWLLVYRAVVRR